MTYSTSDDIFDNLIFEKQAVARDLAFYKLNNKRATQSLTINREALRHPDR